MTDTPAHVAQPIPYHVWEEGYSTALQDLITAGLKLNDWRDRTCTDNPYAHLLGGDSPADDVEPEPKGAEIEVGDVCDYIGGNTSLKGKVRVVKLQARRPEGPIANVRMVDRPSSPTYAVQVKNLKPDPKPVWQVHDRVRYVGPDREIYGLTAYIAETKVVPAGYAAALSFEWSPAATPTWVLAVHLQAAEAPVSVDPERFAAPEKVEYRSHDRIVFHPDNNPQEGVVVGTDTTRPGMVRILLDGDEMPQWVFKYQIARPGSEKLEAPGTYKRVVIAHSSIFRCPTCGAAVVDTDGHTSWHERQVRGKDMLDMLARIDRFEQRYAHDEGLRKAATL